MFVLDFRVLPKYIARNLYLFKSSYLYFPREVEIICSLLPRRNEKYFQSGCSVDLFSRRIILIFSHIIDMNYIIFHNYIIYSFIRL